MFGITKDCARRCQCLLGIVVEMVFHLVQLIYIDRYVYEYALMNECDMKVNEE